LEGVITLEQLQAFLKFQQGVNEEPAVKDILGKLTALTQQVRQLQGELREARMKALTDNVEMKAIADKMQQAMRSHSAMPMMAPGENGGPGHPPGRGLPMPTPTTTPSSGPTPPKS
jgi:hypothetical protein